MKIEERERTDPGKVIIRHGTSDILRNDKYSGWLEHGKCLRVETEVKLGSDHHWPGKSQE